MRDPFRPNTNKQLVREAQFGFTVIGLLIAVLVYVAYYRLNDLGDITPQHISNAPVAMQVFPNSPNYDRDNHQMRENDSPMRVAQRSPFPAERESPLVSTPKRIMDETQSTFRSLGNAAESIQESTAKVNSLASVSVDIQPVGLVSNPAALNPRDSGFKISSKPQPDVATRTLPIPASKLEPAEVSRTPNTSPVQSLLNQFAPIKKTTPPKPKSTRVETMPVKIAPSNEFKPLKSRITATPSGTESPFTPKSFQSQRNLNSTTEPTREKTFAQLPQRLPTLSERSLSNLRSPSETKLADETKFESPSPALSAPTPTIEPVSFEQTTWTVKKGDSFWSIAQSHYGDGRFFRALYEQNRRIVPGFEDLTEGTELFLPTTDELCKMNPDLCPSDAVRKDDPWRTTPDDLMKKLTDACEADLDQRLYETKSGDTLFGIARQQLGQASRYVELLRLNQHRIDTNMTHETELPSGIQLLLPIE